jgi:hypothetical protein
MHKIANTDQANSKSLVWRHTLSHDPVWVARQRMKRKEEKNHPQSFIKIIVLEIFALEIPHQSLSKQTEFCRTIRKMFAMRNCSIIE